MKAQVAMFRSTQFGYEAVSSHRHDGDSDYVRISDWVDIELPELSSGEVIRNQVDALDRMTAKVREEAEYKIARIEQRKAELLALPAPGAAK